MAAIHDETGFNKACTEFGRLAESIIPSLLARLIFLASFREPETGKYTDQVLGALLALKFGKAETVPIRRHEQVIGLQCERGELARVLRHQHLAVFEDWLCLNVEQQMAELECYASSQSIKAPTLIRQWIQERPFERVIPPDALPFQRRLFLEDMETVLATLWRRAFGVQAP
jgi:hypothetical protein